MINEFRGDYFFLSNFYEIPITYENLTYLNNEAAFQSAKLFDKTLRTNFEWKGKFYDFTKMKPSESKSMGRKVNLRSDWELVKTQIMYDICLAKFTQNPNLMKKLIETGNETLIEGNSWHDKEWGVCNGIGENKLGKILMMIRDIERCSQISSCFNCDITTCINFSSENFLPNIKFDKSTTVAKLD